MAKIKETFLSETSKNVKKAYEPCEIEIVLLTEDVLLASAYPAQGNYDNIGDWDFFKGYGL